MHELRYAWRRTWRQPWWSAVAVTSLALGIAACTIIFTLLDRVVLRPLPIRDPHRLVQLSSIDRQNRAGYLPSDALDIIDRTDLFDGVCAFLTPQSTIEIDGEVQPIAALALSGRCFDVLGVRPAAGRLLRPGDDVRGAANAAVLSYNFWQQQFGGARDAIGRTLSIEGEPFTIVGVAERRFTGLQVGFPSKVMVPLRPAGFLPASMRHRLLAANAFARLRPAASHAATFDRFQAIWPDAMRNGLGQASDRTSPTDLRVQMTSAATGLDSTLRARFRVPLLALMGIAVMVLAAASVNVASLHLSRFMERRREYAIRAALGASRRQLMREASLETVLLLVPAVALSAWLAQAGIRVLIDVYAVTSRNFGLDASVDLRTLLFVAALVTVSWLGFGLGPICVVGETPPAAATASGAFGNSAHRSRANWGLVVAQVALTSVLVACAAWFVTSIRELRAAPRGWTAERLVSTRLAAIPGGYDDSFQPSIYYRRLLERVDGLPGVRSSALTNAVPPIPSAFYRERVAPADARDRTADALALRVSDGFFAALQLPLVVGAGFSQSDQPSDARTVVVSETLARQLFDTTAVLDRHVVVRTPGGAQQMLQIVGVAADATIGDPRAGREPTLYLNYWQQDGAFQQFPVLLVRWDAALDDVMAGVRAELAAAGREYPLGISAAIDNVEAMLVQERLLSITSSLFAAIGLLLAAVGLFGLVSRTVVNRTKELGIRLAIGATSRDLIRLVVRDTLICLAAGIAVSIPLVIVTARLLERLLYGPVAYSVGAIATTLALMVASGIVAAWLPARRAARIDPLSTLRLE